MQHILVCFQRLPLSAGKSTRHERDGAILISTIEDAPCSGSEIFLQKTALKQKARDIVRERLHSGVWRLTRLVISAMCVAAWQARVNWPLVVGSTGFWPGAANRATRAMRYPSRPAARWWITVSACPRKRKGDIVAFMPLKMNQRDIVV
jgi:hypothetical protein